ncbi:kinase-like protein [Caulochytrium protostelioides]|uniref:Kinase-like protein n=1 Tax=Caulochytrium protostelioides TaxID=1555241 RepID=A0A4P9WU30_9FUNG|nr:kinase-like protein [Caulochytrium protostelioides]
MDLEWELGPGMDVTSPPGPMLDPFTPLESVPAPASSTPVPASAQAPTWSSHAEAQGASAGPLDPPGPSAQAAHDVHMTAADSDREDEAEEARLMDDAAAAADDAAFMASLPPNPPPVQLFYRFLGTVQYAAPEILRGEKYRGPEAEVWALGCCLYIMLSGEVPFVAPAQALHGTFTPCRYPLSPACLHLLGRLLEKSDRRRITILEVVQHPWLRDYVTLV